MVLLKVSIQAILNLLLVGLLELRGSNLASDQGYEIIGNAHTVPQIKYSSGTNIIHNRKILLLQIRVLGSYTVPPVQSGSVISVLGSGLLIRPPVPVIIQEVINCLRKLDTRGNNI